MHPPFKSGQALVRQEDLWVWLRDILSSINKPLVDMSKMNNMGTTTRNAVQAVQMLMEAIRHPRNAPHHLPHWIAHVENLAPVQVRGSELGCRLQGPAARPSSGEGL